MSLERLDKISAILAPAGPVLRLLPAVAKYLFYLLILINAKSLPLVWHWRVFKPAFELRLRYRLLRLRHMWKPRAVQVIEEDAWLDSICPIGAHPFEKSISYHSRATIDDSDFNGHLSNSSYAKTIDSARFKAALAMFPHVFRVGGWMALAATHYHFIREVPMLSKYEIKVSIGAWDQKWIYVILRFVTKSKKKSGKSGAKHGDVGLHTPGTQDLFNASVRIPSDEISSTGTPFSMNTPPHATSVNTVEELKAVSAGLLATDNTDDEVLHTIAVSQLCYKFGRITIPPALVIACNGFSAPPSPVAANGSALSDGSASQPAAYSHANPPPHWGQVKAVMSKPAGGNTKALAALLKGGWRDVPENERWWDHALAGVEERRKSNLEILGMLRGGMEGLRAIS
ncbi:hypothetical protein BD779DRAFT_1680805 [Infundibulicybe gibba]|nr:hypothetical protein BD779DRAFT_1680805 [Infundibulicybe gibba]